MISKKTSVSQSGFSFTSLLVDVVLYVDVTNSLISCFFRENIIMHGHEEDWHYDLVEIVSETDFTRSSRSYITIIENRLSQHTGERERESKVSLSEMSCAIFQNPESDVTFLFPLIFLRAVVVRMRDYVQCNVGNFSHYESSPTRIYSLIYSDTGFVLRHHKLMCRHILSYVI